MAERVPKLWTSEPPVRTLPFTATALVLLATGVLASEGDKASYERSREEIEDALDLEATLRTPARIRPRDPVQLAASLVNRSGKTALKVIRPGDGSSSGLVEPHVHVTARYRPTPEDAWRTVAPREAGGLCGLGDFRWHRNVFVLAPGGSLALTEHLQAANGYVEFEAPGEYELRLHYDYRRRGTTEKLPQGDPVGDLGPMKRMPAYHVTSDPILVTVVHPIEVVVEPLDVPTKGMARRLSDLVSVRVENWTTQPLELNAKSLKIVVQLRAAPDAMRVRRKPISVVGGLAVRTLAPGKSAVIVGAGGVYDEAWVAESEGTVELHAVVAGVQPGSSRVRSTWVALRRP